MKPIRQGPVKCEQCGAHMRFKVALLLDCDDRVFHRLSKANLRTSLVSVDGADWPNSYWYCPLSYKHEAATKPRKDRKR